MKDDIRRYDNDNGGSFTTQNVFLINGPLIRERGKQSRLTISSRQLLK